MGNPQKPVVILYPHPCRYSVHRYRYRYKKIYPRVTCAMPYS